MNKFLIVYGTRPEAIKLKPLIEEMEKEGVGYRTLFTGQQKDLVDRSRADFVNHSIDGKSGDRLSDLVCGCVDFVGFALDNGYSYYQENLDPEMFTHVIVQGDTASAYAGALAAFHRQIPVIHIEAGLRTYAKDPFPEEFYRRSISLMATYHFCPTIQNKVNTSGENLFAKCYVVGNTGLDGLDDSDVTVGNGILVTFHRRENKEKANSYAAGLADVIRDNENLDFFIVKHPNETNKSFVEDLRTCLRLSIGKDWEGKRRVSFLEPLNHEGLIQKIKTCRLIISDSGGLQEESAYFGKRCLILRGETERPEGLKFHHDLCFNPSSLPEDFKDIITDKPPIETRPCPFGDGHASEKIVKVLKDI